MAVLTNGANEAPPKILFGVVVQQTVHYDVLQDEDRNAHIAKFIGICDTFKINRVFDDTMWPRLYPLSLRGKAK